MNPSPDQIASEALEQLARDTAELIISCTADLDTPPSSREYEINYIAPIILSALISASLADKAEIERQVEAGRYWVKEAERLRTENQRLREALKPFAKAFMACNARYGSIGSDWFLNGMPREWELNLSVTMADGRAAAALSDSAGEGKV